MISSQGFSSHFSYIHYGCATSYIEFQILNPKWESYKLRSRDDKMADCTLDPCTNFSHCPPTAIIENTSVTVALPVITIFFVIMFVIGAVLGCIDMMTKNFRSCG